MMNNKQTISRRGLIKGSIGGFAGLSAGALGAPAIINASDDTIRVGHITPRSGFLGTLGDYGFRGVNLAVEELNAAGEYWEGKSISFRRTVLVLQWQRPRHRN